MDLEIRRIQYVVRVAEEKSFSRAAQKLHIAQPSLSQQIAKLEKELGVILFQRSPAEVTLTRAGEVFYQSAVEILDRVEQLKKEMYDVARLKKGKLNIGSMSMTGAHLLPLALPAFRQQYEGIEITLIEDSTGKLEEMTAKGQLDISLLSLPIAHTSLAYEPLLEEEIFLAVPPNHPLATKDSVKVNSLADESFIMIKQGLGFHDLSRDICLQAGFEPRIVFESSNIETIQSLVCAGMGVAFVPRMVMRSSQKDDFAPVYVRLTDPAPRRTIVIAYREQSYLSQAAHAFIQVIKKQIMMHKKTAARE